MIRKQIIWCFCITASLLITACSGGDDIPEEVSDAAQEEVRSNNDANEIESEALSIKEAAAQAVKIVEDDAQQEINAIKPLTTSETEKTITPDDNDDSEQASSEE